MSGIENYRKLYRAARQHPGRSRPCLASSSNSICQSYTLYRPLCFLQKYKAVIWVQASDQSVELKGKTYTVDAEWISCK